MPSSVSSGVATRECRRRLHLSRPPPSPRGPSFRPPPTPPQTQHCFDRHRQRQSGRWWQQSSDLDGGRVRAGKCCTAVFVALQCNRSVQFFVKHNSKHFKTNHLRWSTNLCVMSVIRWRWKYKSVCDLPRVQCAQCTRHDTRQGNTDRRRTAGRHEHWSEWRTSTFYWEL